jgi:hypothetical protein
MTRYPAVLKPTSYENITIGVGKTIPIPKATPTFSPWVGNPIDDDYNGKQILNVNGRPAFAELAILWAMQAEEWDGVWIDTYRRKYRTGYWGASPINDLYFEQKIILEKIYSRIDSRTGAWDVYCWKGPSVLFIEAKRSHHDNIRETQRKFLAAGMQEGFAPENFLVVEWSLGIK